MNEHVTTAIVAIVSSLGTYFATRIQSQYSLRSKKIESDSATEGIYVQNMEMILREYKEQVSSFRDEVSTLREENRLLKKDFDSFKRKHREEMDEYKKYVDLLETENENLKEENADLKEEISILIKGEI